MNAGVGKLCIRSLKGHVVQGSLNLCCCRVSKISWRFRKSKENLPFTFCSICSILLVFRFFARLLIEKKKVDLLRNKHLGDKSYPNFTAISSCSVALKTVKVENWKKKYIIEQYLERISTPKYYVLYQIIAQLSQSITWNWQVLFSSYSP